MDENKNENSKRDFLKKLAKTAAGAVLFPVISQTEALGEVTLNEGPNLTPSASASPFNFSLSPSATPSPSTTSTATMTVSLSPSPSSSSTPFPTPSPSSILTGIEENLKSEGIEIGTFNPNPTTDRSFLIVITSKPVSVDVSVFDIKARNVFSKNYFLRTGTNSVEVQLPVGEPGYYQVMLDFEGKVVKRRIATL